MGTSHLRQEPEKKKQIVDSSIQRPDDQAKKLVGFYDPADVSSFVLLYSIDIITIMHGNIDNCSISGPRRQ